MLRPAPILPHQKAERELADILAEGINRALLAKEQDKADAEKAKPANVLVPLSPILLHEYADPELGRKLADNLNRALLAKARQKLH